MPQRLKYNDENIALVKTGIENLIKTNSEYSYGVKVNGVIIVPKTKDISLFDSFLDHVNESTEAVVFTNYFGTAKGGDTITLYVGDFPAGEKPVETKTVLNGMPDVNEIRKQVQAEIHNQYLKEENERLKTELGKAQKFVKEVDVLIGQLKAQRSQVKDKGTLEYIGNFVSRLTVSHPEMFKDNPALDILAGLFPVSEETKNTTAPPVMNGTEVTIKPKSESAVLDKQTEELVEVLKKLRRHFSEIEFGLCLELLASMRDHKELIAVAKDWVCRQIELKLAWIKRMQEGEQKDEPEEKEEPEVKVKSDEAKTYPPYEDEPGIYHP